LIDLHAVRVNQRLDWQASRDNLVILNHWFMVRASRTDRLRFWRAYYDMRQRLGDSVTGASGHSRQDAMAKAVDLERRSWKSNLQFWAHRDRRCLSSNRYFRPVRSAVAVGHAVSDLDQEALQILLADPDAPFEKPGIPLIKNSRSSTVAEFDMLVGG